MPLVGILFDLEVAETLPGETVSVAGSRPELGGWHADPGEAVQLGTSTFMFPRWTSMRPLWLRYRDEPGGPQSLTFEYKYVVAHGESAAKPKWEAGENRRAELPLQDGALWLIADAGFGRCSPASVSQTSMQEVRSRWASFVPEWMASQVARGGPDRFLLTPRVPLQAVDEAEIFDIESEFSLLSPRAPLPAAPLLDTVAEAELRAAEAAAVPDTGAEAELRATEMAAVLDTGARRAAETGAEAEPCATEPEDTVALPRRDYTALLLELEALREGTRKLHGELCALRRPPRHAEAGRKAPGPLGRALAAQSARGP